MCFKVLNFKFRPDPVTFGGVAGETGILGKHENWGIFILRIDDQIVMKSDFQKEFMSQSSYFKSRLDLLTLGGVGGGNLGKTIGV